MDKTPLDEAPAPPAQPAPKPHAHEQQSWGDKYKAGTLRFIRNDAVNYGVNFAGSAAFAYLVVKEHPEVIERHPTSGESIHKTTWVNQKFRNAINWTAKQGSKVGVPEAVSREIGGFFTRTQLLLCGGHALLPFMKYTHDNRHLLEFAVGHRLDAIQQGLGLGNDKTRKNLEEYKYVKDLLAVKPQTLTEKDKALLAKNGIDEDFNFKEHHQTWKHVGLARGAGVVMTTGLSVALAVSSSTGKVRENGKPNWLNYKNISEPAGEFIGEKVVKKIPFLGSKIKYPVQLGGIIFLELIYTAFSKLGFDHMEKHLLKKQEAQEKAAKAAELAQDRTSFEDSSAAPVEVPAQSHTAHAASALDARRKITEGGGKDFRARAAKPAEVSMAVS